MNDSNYEQIITHRTTFLNYSNYHSNNQELCKKSKKKKDIDKNSPSFDKLLKQECDKLL